MKGQRIEYFADELAWIEARKDWPRRDLHAAFVARFEREDVSEENIKRLCARKGWSAGPEGRRRTAGVSPLFSADEIAWIRENGRLPRAEAHARFTEAFGRNDISLAQLASFRKRHGIKTGRTGQFAKGQTPWSKGRKIGSHPNSASQQFKPGMVAHNTLPLGTERLRDDGYIEVKVAETNPYTGAPTWFVMKHKLLWEALHGPVPEGHALKCLDGDRTNTDPANWAAVPRGLLPRLNGKSVRNYDTAEPEVKPAIMAVARLEQRAAKIRKGK